MRKIVDKKRFGLFTLGIILIACGIVFAVYEIAKWRGQSPAIEEMTIEGAAKIGEKKIVQLLVQIADSQEGRYERGDVILSAPEDKQFSSAEREGFLIIKIRITPQQQQLMELALNEKVSFLASKQDGKEDEKTLKRRKFAVDLAKIGIGPEQKTGKIIADKIFEDDVLTQK